MSVTAVAASGHREGNRRVQFDHFGTEFSSRLDTAVGGTGIDVDHASGFFEDRSQATNQALPLVATDDHHAEVIFRHAGEPL